MPSINFKSIKKGHLTVEFTDGLKLTLKPPKMKILRMAQELSQNEEDLQGVLELFAAALSSNTEGKTFTPEDVEDLFDVEDFTVFGEHYGNFISEIRNRKNF